MPNRAKNKINIIIIMPRKTSEKNKCRFVGVRFTEEEYASILEKSKQFALKNVSQYVRKHLLNQKMYVETHDKTGENFNISVSNYTEQIKKIGRNYNQIVRYLQAKHSPKETKELLGKIEKMTENVLKISALTHEISKKVLQYYDSKNQ